MCAQYTQTLSTWGDFHGFMGPSKHNGDANFISESFVHVCDPRVNSKQVIALRTIRTSKQSQCAKLRVTALLAPDSTSAAPNRRCICIFKLMWHGAAPCGETSGIACVLIDEVPGS